MFLQIVGEIIASDELLSYESDVTLSPHVLCYTQINLNQSMVISKQKQKLLAIKQIKSML